MMVRKSAEFCKIPAVDEQEKEVILIQFFFTNFMLISFWHQQNDQKIKKEEKRQGCKILQSSVRWRDQNSFYPI